MIKLKDIEKKLKKEKVRYFRSENEQFLYVYSCDIGNNFYDYGEEEPPLKIKSEFSFLKDDFRIKIIRCCDCCCCAGW